MKKRILMIDNEWDFLETRVERLDKEGYDVYSATTIEEAERLLHDVWVHVIIVDVRMRDHEDDKDTSGLSVAKDERFRPIPKLVLTQFPSYDYVREALGPAEHGPPAVGFLDKKEGPEVMLEAIEKALLEHVRINWDLMIRLGDLLSFPHLVSLIVSEEESQRLPDRAMELADLFRKLFYDDNQITITRLLSRGAGAVFLEVIAYEATGLGRQFVVCCGRKELVEEEKQRHALFVPQGTGLGGTEKVKSAETMRFGATAYALVGGTVEDTATIGRVYHRRPADEMLAVLDNLFNATLARWYEKGRFRERERSLNELCCEWLQVQPESLRPARLGAQVEAICRETLRAGLVEIDCSPHALIFQPSGGEPVTYPNPAGALAEGRIALGPPVLCGVSHGGVGADNVLVDREGQTWLIDFSRAGRGPLLRDFVSLETAIKLDLLDVADLHSRYELERRLVSADPLGIPITVDDPSPDIAKALAAVERVRHHAAAVVGQDGEPYFGGLLYCAIARLATYDPNARYNRRDLMPFAHALLSATLLCDALAKPAPLPAELSTQARHSIWLDEPNAAVWVEGRPVDLTPQDYNLLAYLYERAGQLCSRQAIVEEGLGEVFLVAITEETRLNSAISRLRQKIEPDPARPKYIVTVRGRGYKLTL